MVHGTSTAHAVAKVLVAWLPPAHAVAADTAWGVFVTAVVLDSLNERTLPLRRDQAPVAAGQ